MKIAIPTYGRANALKNFQLCCDIVGKENVFVFFHHEEDKKDYLQNYDIKNPVVTNNPKGIAKQRNSILNYFELGEKIIMIDDDISNIYKFVDEKTTKTLSPTEINEEFEKAFDLCEKNNTKLFGVYPVNNPYFMNNRVSPKGLMIGWIMGIIVSDLRFDEQFQTKEDYDFGFQHLVKYKKFVRLNYLTCNAGFKTGQGGLSFVYGTEREKDACEKLLKKWPNIIKPHPKRENEVKLTI